MSFRTLALASAATVFATVSFAQAQPQGGQYPQAAPTSQQAPERSGRHKSGRHHFGVKALIGEEMRAGRLSEKEGTLLMHKIKEMHAERRAERDSGRGGEGPIMQPQTQQPH